MTLVDVSPAGPLRTPAFRRYLGGQLQSVTCSWMQVVALSWVLVDRYPAALGWVVALQFGPSLILGPWFGALIDRNDRRRMLIAAEAGLGLVAAAYAVAAVAGHLTLPLICVLATAWGVLNALDTPARQALVPVLVRPAQAARAAAMAGVIVLVGMTVGSALGAAVVASAGAGAAFAANAASFLLDVVILSTIRVAASVRVDRRPRQLREGFAYVRRTAELRTPLLALAVLGSLAFTVQVSVPVLLRQGFLGGASLVGAGFTAVTAGGVAGAIFAAVRGAPAPQSLRRACAMMALSSAVVAVATDLPVALAALSGVGLAWSLLVMSSIAALQRAEPAMLGRVMSWLAVVLVGGTTAGGPLAGAVGELAGPRAPFVLGAAAAAATIAIAGWSDARGAGRGQLSRTPGRPPRTRRRDRAAARQAPESRGPRTASGAR